MTVLFMLGMFALFIGIDYCRKPKVYKGVIRFSVPGYEQLGAVACDGGEKVKDGQEGTSPK